MKKIILVTVIMMFAAVPAFAATGAVTLGADPDSMVIQTSNNVDLTYDGGTDGDTFTVTTFHDKGTRTYSSSSADAKIFYQDETGVANPDAPAVGETVDYSAWTAL